MSSAKANIIQEQRVLPENKVPEVFPDNLGRQVHKVHPDHAVLVGHQASAFSVY